MKSSETGRSSKAIGRGGHNIRLAGQLTGCRDHVLREGAEEDVELTRIFWWNWWVDHQRIQKIGLDTAKVCLEKDVQFFGEQHWFGGRNHSGRLITYWKKNLRRSWNFNCFYTTNRTTGKHFYGWKKRTNYARYFANSAFRWIVPSNFWISKGLMLKQAPMPKYPMRNTRSFNEVPNR